MDLKYISVAELSDLTASKSAAPGGGSISAMAGAYAASLVCMVAKLTEGKKSYEAVSTRMKEIDTLSEALRLSLLDDIQLDSASFDDFMKALAMPKITEDQMTARAEAMQGALKGACRIPHQVAGKALKVLNLALEAVRFGNANAISDGLVGAFLAQAAVLGAISNVRINLASIKDREFVKKMAGECDDLEQKERAAEKEVNLLMQEKIAGAS